MPLMKPDAPSAFFRFEGLIVLWLLGAGLAACTQEGDHEMAAEKIEFCSDVSGHGDRTITLEAHMARFGEALMQNDTNALLRFFPHEGSWRYIGTIYDPETVTEISMAELESDFMSETGWYEIIIDAEGDDVFRDHFARTNGRPWTYKGGNKFVPPDIGDQGLVYVAWRKENSNCVVDAIAEPAS